MIALSMRWIFSKTLTLFERVPIKQTVDMNYSSFLRY
jgi:hypothetical protein